MYSVFSLLFDKKKYSGLIPIFLYAVANIQLSSTSIEHPSDFNFIAIN